MTKLVPKLVQSTKSSAPEITGKAKLLVDTLVASGCTITEASKVAGYKGNSARVSASRMLRKPEVQQYMMQEIQRSMGLNSAKLVPSWYRFLRVLRVSMYSSKLVKIS